MWEKGKSSGQFLFLSECFPIQIVSVRNVKRFREIQSWSWIIQICIKDAKLWKQPVHFIESIEKTLGNENKYYLFLSYVLKEHSERRKHTFFFFPITNHKVPWNQDLDLISKKEVKLNHGSKQSFLFFHYYYLFISILMFLK